MGDGLASLLERREYSRGRRLKAQPAKSKGAKLYGYDVVKMRRDGPPALRKRLFCRSSRRASFVAARKREVLVDDDQPIAQHAVTGDDPVVA